MRAREEREQDEVGQLGGVSIEEVDEVGRHFMWMKSGDQCSRR